MSTIANAKKGCGWQHPNERRGCLGCQHGFQETQGAGFCPPGWRCTLHGFYTHRNAICDRWTERKAGRA